jgi:hypothetical protein
MQHSNVSGCTIVSPNEQVIVRDGCKTIALQQKNAKAARIF